MRWVGMGIALGCLVRFRRFLNSGARNRCPQADAGQCRRSLVLRIVRGRSRAGWVRRVERKFFLFLLFWWLKVNFWLLFLLLLQEILTHFPHSNLIKCWLDLRILLRLSRTLLKCLRWSQVRFIGSGAALFGRSFPSDWSLLYLGLCGNWTLGSGKWSYLGLCGFPS